VVDKTPPQAIGHSRSNLSEHTEREDVFQIRSTDVVVAKDTRACESVGGRDVGLGREKLSVYCGSRLVEKNC